MNLKGSPKQIAWAKCIINGWETLWQRQRDSMWYPRSDNPPIVYDVAKRLPRMLATSELLRSDVADLPAAVLARAKVIEAGLKLTREDVNFAIPALIAAHPDAGWFCNNRGRKLADILALGMVEAITAAGGWPHADKGTVNRGDARSQN